MVDLYFGKKPHAVTTKWELIFVFFLPALENNPRLSEIQFSSSLIASNLIGGAP